MFSILHEIATSYKRFFIRHTGWNENFNAALVFNNPALPVNRHTQETADADFFGELMQNHTAAIHKLKVSDIFHGGYVSPENFLQNTGIPITL